MVGRSMRGGVVGDCWLQSRSWGREAGGILSHSNHTAAKALILK